jgi:methyl-accepting chemotaxis protein
MLLTGLVLALSGIGIALYVYRGISQPLQDLQDTVDRVRAGEELKEAEGVRSQDEIGGIWRTVHGLLSERREAQLKAEAENERLNQSVISILESVHQMSQRDLTVKAPVTQDVIGTVSDSINSLTAETSKVLHGVTQIAGHVAEASDKVRSQAEMVSRTAEDERNSVSKMIESLTHASQTMNQVAALAEQSNTSATKATAVTDTALETVNGTVKGMESIRETIAETEKRIKRLGERSQEISGIVNLINTISERTHVLALNASMQAAVAGEAGRGFAVVAEEVQRLAESSRNATQQISTLVNNIQLETNETISTVNRTIGQVVQGSEQAQKAGEQMRVTQQITNELVAQVKRIAEVSEQQREMSAALLESVQHIGQSTERTASQISAQNRETESLLQSARRLVESVNVFKLPKMA